MVVLPGISLTPAPAAAERIRARIENSEIVVGAQRIKVTTSFSVCMQEMGRTSEDAQGAANAALYQTNAARRNRVVTAGLTVVDESGDLFKGNLPLAPSRQSKQSMALTHPRYIPK